MKLKNFTAITAVGIACIFASADAKSDRNDIFSEEELKMLAEVERKMDAGEVQYVINRGHRMMVSDHVMEDLELEVGQSITPEIARNIMQRHLAATIIHQSQQSNKE